MKATVTVRLDDDVNQQLTEAAEALGRSRNDIVRDALRRQLSVLRFETLREQVMPFAETRRVLRDKLGVSADTVKDIERFLRRHHVEPTPEADPPVSVRDPDDEPIRAAAIAAEANVLVTGDKDLLDVADQVESLRIMTPRAFWETARLAPGSPTQNPHTSTSGMAARTPPMTRRTYPSILSTD